MLYHVLVRDKGNFYWTDVYETYFYPIALIVAFFQGVEHYEVEIRKGEPVIGGNK